MSDAETKPTLTTIVLIAILVLNVLGIGLSEVQRRQLGQQSFLATLELRDVEKQRLEQQAQELDRLYKVIANIDQRISKVQAALDTAELTRLNNLVANVDQRMSKVQAGLESGAAGNVDERISKVQAALEAAELPRLNNLAANIEQRINKLQVALESGPLALQVKDIQERINAVQIRMEQASSRK